MTPVEITTLAIAAVGLLLGIRSEWRAHQHDKVRIRVVPKISYPVGPVPDPSTRLAIEVINESQFAVTIDEVGFMVHGERNRFAITVPIIVDGKSWPRRLEPHDAVIAYANLDPRLLSLLEKLKSAYASTATGRTFEGTSNALRRVSRTGAIPPFRRGRSVTGLPGFINVSEVND